LLGNPDAILFNDFFSVSIGTDPEGVSPFGRASDVDIVGFIDSDNACHNEYLLSVGALSV
jgi:hypothetical protein